MSITKAQAKRLRQKIADYCWEYHDRTTNSRAEEKALDRYIDRLTEKKEKPHDPA